MLKVKDFLIVANTAQEAALEAAQGTWNEETKQLVAETIELVQQTATTGVYTAVWSAKTEVCKEYTLTVFLQEYDKTLSMYSAKVTTTRY